MDKEVTARFDSLDQQIKAWRDAIATNTKAVSDMQVAFGELQKPRQPKLHVPTWLTGRGDAAA
jgi:hypothetical protein